MWTQLGAITAQVARALSELARAHPVNQSAIAASGGIAPLIRLLNENETDIDTIAVEPEALAELSMLVDAGTINQNAGREVLGTLCAEGGSPRAIVEARGLAQISDTSELEQIVAEVIGQNAAAVEKIRGGNDKPLKFLMGQVMKATRGKANPQLVQEQLKKQLGV